MSRLAVDGYSLSAGVQIALAVLGVLGFVLTVASFVLMIHWSPRKSNELPKLDLPLRSVRFWRPSHYSLAVGYLQEFRDRLKSGAYHTGGERGWVTESDLVRWIIQLGLTCAAQMVPQSLGKANLFRVSSLRRNNRGQIVEVKVYASEFVGAFPLAQLTNHIDQNALRYLAMKEHTNAHQVPAALQCINKGTPIVHSLRKRHADLDEPERDLGTTHILAIPLFTGVGSIKAQDQVVSITVDLKYGWLMGRWLDRRIEQRTLYRTSLYRRAVQLAKLLTDIRQLSDPRFLPLSNREAKPGPPDGPK